MLARFTDPNGEDLLLNLSNVLFVTASGSAHCEVVFWVHENDEPISRRVQGTLAEVESRFRNE